MEELTERQINILKTIINEYIETAEPVGSEKIEKKYSLGISPATIRNEMAKLTETGFLKQPHTSAGRVPTPKAFKFYVERLIEEKNLSVAEEVKAKEQVWDARDDFGHLMHQAMHALAQQAQSLAVAATDEGEVYHSGYANLLSMPEFYDIDVTKAILSLLDESKSLTDLFAKALGEDPIHFLFGEELGYELLEPCGMVFTHFQAGPKKSGSLGVIGPSRLDYARVIPIVRYYGNLVEELARGI